MFLYGLMKTTFDSTLKTKRRCLLPVIVEGFFLHPSLMECSQGRSNKQRATLRTLHVCLGPLTMLKLVCGMHFLDPIVNRWTSDEDMLDIHHVVKLLVGLLILIEMYRPTMIIIIIISDRIVKMEVGVELFRRWGLKEGGGG